MTTPDDGDGKHTFEYPDESGYPDGTGYLNEGTTQAAASEAAATDAAATAALVDEVAARSGDPATRRKPVSDYDLSVDNDTEHLKYEAWLNENTIADLNYTFSGRRIVLLATSVRHSYRGHGIATELIARSLDDIRASGRTITIICPVVRTFIDHYPEYADLIDPVHPGVASQVASGSSHASMPAVDDDDVTAFEQADNDPPDSVGTD